jgi:hypothetical protein
MPAFVDDADFLSYSHSLFRKERWCWAVYSLFRGSPTVSRVIYPPAGGVSVAEARPSGIDRLS